MFLTGMNIDGNSPDGNDFDALKRLIFGGFECADAKPRFTGGTMKIYLASPFFSEEELAAVEDGEKILASRGFEVYSPRMHEAPCRKGTAEWSLKTFLLNKEAIDCADAVVVLYWGNFSDTGTAWECGYAFGAGIPSVVVHLGGDSNLMIHEGTRSNLLEGIDALREYDFERLPGYRYEGKMY